MVTETSELSNANVVILGMPMDISNGDLVCSIFDKRYASNFHIVNFADLYGNITTAPLMVHTYTSN